LPSLSYAAAQEMRRGAGAQRPRAQPRRHLRQRFHGPRLPARTSPRREL
jgi:hypothetical protein